MSSEPTNRCCPTDSPVLPCEYTPAGDSLYVVGPYTSKAGIVIVGDIFGPLDNSKRFADVLGAAGYLVVMPDYFGAAAWAVEEFPPDYESDKWKAFFKMITTPEPHRVRTRRAIALLRKLGCTSIATLGMCWGAGVSFDMGSEGLVEAVSTAHPSFLMPAYVKAAANMPICVLPSKNEPPMEDVKEAIAAHPKLHVFKRYDTLVHGFFAAHYSPEDCDKAQKKEMQDAYDTLIEFFRATLH